MYRAVVVSVSQDCPDPQHAARGWFPERKRATAGSPGATGQLLEGRGRRSIPGRQRASVLAVAALASITQPSRGSLRAGPCIAAITQRANVLTPSPGNTPQRASAQPATVLFRNPRLKGRNNPTGTPGHGRRRIRVCATTGGRPEQRGPELRRLVGAPPSTNQPGAGGSPTKGRGGGRRDILYTGGNAHAILVRIFFILEQPIAFDAFLYYFPTLIIGTSAQAT